MKCAAFSTFTLAALLCILGCSQPTQSAPVQAIKPVAPNPDYSRFQSVNGQPIKYALDTKTGILCQTYDKPSGTTDPKLEGVPIPFCMDLYEDEEGTIKTVTQMYDKQLPK